jgi:hypothetical protein
LGLGPWALGQLSWLARDHTLDGVLREQFL